MDGEIRANASAFWGATLPTSAHASAPVVQVLPNLDRLIQTLPHLSSTVTTPFLESAISRTPTHTPRPSKADAIIASTASSVQATPPSTLGKRKAATAFNDNSTTPTTTADALAAQDDMTSLTPTNDISDNDDPTAARAERKRQRREEKKAAQVARRAARAAAAANGTLNTTTASATPQAEADAAEDMPFDYASAPSVLNPAVAEGEAGMRKKEKKRKEYNPYVRTMEAPGGVKRSGPVSTGRTGTFKS